MSESWHGVLDTQLDLLRFWRSDLGAQVAAGFATSMDRVEAEYGNRGGVALAKQLRGVVINGLAHASPFYVDEHMMTLVEAAAETFEPEELHETDFLADNAFVLLPRPLYMLDRHGRRCAFRAISWNRMMLVNEDDEDERTAGIVLCLYSDVYDEDDYTPLNDAQFPEGWRDMLVARDGTTLTLLHVTPWPFGIAYPAAGLTDADRVDPVAVEQMGRVSWWPAVQSFLRLSQQTIAVRDKLVPPRAARKRWKRMQGNEDNLVTVVRLRRPRSHKEGEPGSVEWKHSWIVSGHWRRQWYPSLRMHRQIWISPYTKGPEDAPLLVKHGRAFVLTK